MKILKLYILLISFTLFSCGVKVNHNYSLDISKSNEYLNNGNIINLAINNPSNNLLTDLTFSIDDIKIETKHVLNNKLGVNTLRASFKVNNEIFIVQKDISIY